MFFCITMFSPAQNNRKNRGKTMNKKLLSVSVLAVAPAVMLALPVNEAQKAMQKIYAKTAAPAQKILEYSDVAGLNLSAKSYILTDYFTGEVLVSHNANQKLPIASMTKMMTMLLLLEANDTGAVSLSDQTTISEYAASQEGSECFLDAGQRYTLIDLLRAVAIASANDASVAIAEHLAGTEKAFAEKMNARAQELNMTNTTFKNSTGLDEAGHESTAEDMAKLIRVVGKRPELAKFSKTWMDELVHPSGRKTELVNTNRLVKTYPELVFAKTGSTDGAGYCITAMAKRGDTTLICSILGESDSKKRFADSVSLLNFGFANFESKKLLSAETSLGKLPLKGANKSELNLYAQEDYQKLIKKGEPAVIATDIQINGNIKLPLKAGDAVGTVIIKSESGEEISRMPLVVREDAEAVKFGEIVDKIISQNR